MTQPTYDEDELDTGKLFSMLGKQAALWREADLEIASGLEIAIQVLATDEPDDSTAERIIDEMAIIAGWLLANKSVTEAIRPRLTAIRSASRMFGELEATESAKDGRE